MLDQLLQLIVYMLHLDTRRFLDGFLMVETHALSLGKEFYVTIQILVQCMETLLLLHLEI